MSDEFTVELAVRMEGYRESNAYHRQVNVLGLGVMATDILVARWYVMGVRVLSYKTQYEYKQVFSQS